MSIKLLVFDLDGTIVDSKLLWKTAIYKVLRRNGYAFSKEKIEKVIGQKRLMATLLDMKVKEPDRIKKEINEYPESLTRYLKPCPNIDAIKKLRLRYATCVLTSSPRIFTEPILKKLGLEFDMVLCEEDVANKVEGLKTAAKAFGAKPREMLYIADTLHDPEWAKRFGCHCVLLKACSFDKKKLMKQKSENIIWDFSKLPEYLNNL